MYNLFVNNICFLSFQDCPVGWTKSPANSCVIANGTLPAATDSVSDAQTRCWNNFMTRIVETHNVAMMQFVSSFALSENWGQTIDAVYVNAYRQTNTLTLTNWVWGSGYSPFDVTGEWAPGQPSGAATENCAAVGVAGGTWAVGLNDAICSNPGSRIGVICEIPCNCLAGRT